MNASEEFTAHVLVCLVALGMALSFIRADPDSPTSRALAVGFAFIGIGIDLNVVMTLQWDLPDAIHGWFAIAEAIAIIAILEWILRVRRTIPAGKLQTRFGDRMLRVGQGAAVLYALLGILFPETRLDDFLGGLDEDMALHRWGFWMFAAPILVSALTAIASIVLLLNRKPDSPERVRVLAMAVAIPFMVAGFVVPLQYSAISMILGEMIFLLGAVQYHVLQGQRGQFMSRFLSDQVAELVRKRGLRHAMQQNFLEITVVSCDLRGFTPYAQANASSRVIEVLKDYYDAVGAVVAEFGATIKDFAGDGILMLVGAPLPIPDHARQGLALAQRVRTAAKQVTARWSTPTHHLGVGIGVASGKVTVGIIGSASRLEYTAVGAAVNLGSRLCEQAKDGEILVDARTIELGELAGGDGVASRTPIPIKGFNEPVPLFALTGA